MEVIVGEPILDIGNNIGGMWYECWFVIFVYVAFEIVAGAIMLG